MSGELDKHATSGAILLDPSRRISRCGSCCGETCLYAIRAEPCWQELTEDCEDSIAPLWFCVESKCFGGSQDFSQIKTPVVFLYTAPGDIERCWETVPSSITLVAKLSAEIQAALITDTALECVEDGCGSSECPAPEDACVCVCRGADGDSDGHPDCCMSRWDGSGAAPWTFTYRRTIVSTVTRTRIGAGLPPTDCPSVDCNESAACIYFAYEEEIDEAELAASYTAILEQPCTKEVPIRGRVTTSKTALIFPLSYPCCSATNAPTGWASAGTISVPPPAIYPHSYSDTDSGIIPGDGGCYSRTRSQITVDGDCTFYRYELIEDLWSSQNSEPGVCGCQQLDRTVTTIEYEFLAASDEATARLCAQCAAYEGP